MIAAFRKSINYIFRDGVNFSLAMVPILIGLSLYIYLGKKAYTDGLEWMRGMVTSHVTAGSWGDFLYYVLISILTIVMFFLISWTFVLVVSILASPFNDLISARVERAELGQKQLSFADASSNMFSKFFKTILNESKKIFVIAILALISMLFNFIPILVPISIVLSALLLSIQFVDYSWSRHNLRFGSCMQDLRSNWMRYIMSGLVVLIFVSIPVVNIFVTPIASAFYTILWVKNHKV
jgi:CysZ protein